MIGTFHMHKENPVTDTFRVGLIGTGRIGLVHAGSIADTPGAELTYIADPFVDGAHKLAAQFGGKVTDNPLELLNSGEVDVVVIASPTPTHVDLISAAIDAGVHAMCEKPIDLDITRANALRDKVAAAKTHVALGFNRRFHPQFAEINARVAAGEIGALEQLTIISRDPGEPPASYIAVSGGIFRDMTIHDFDMARWLLGEEPVELFAYGSCLVDPAVAKVGDTDSAMVVMKTASGKLCHINNSRRASYGYDQRLEVHGSKGRLMAGNRTATTVELADANAVSGDKPLYFFLERYADAYRAELAAFVQAVINRQPLPVTAHDGRQAIVLAEAAVKSLRTGLPVRI